MQEPTISGARAPRLLRGAGVLILDLLGVVVVPTILEESVWFVVPARSVMMFVVKQWCLDLTVAAFMGFMMYRMWQSNTSKWVWILPALWFAFGAMAYAGPPHVQSVLSEHRGFWFHFSGRGCANHVMDCRDFYSFTVPLIRSISYSIAALLSSRILRRKAALFPSR